MVLSLYGLKLFVTNLCTRLDLPTPMYVDICMGQGAAVRWRDGRMTGEGENVAGRGGGGGG